MKVFAYSLQLPTIFNPIQRSQNIKIMLNLSIIYAKNNQCQVN